MTAIWKTPISLDILCQRGQNTLAEHLDISFTNITDHSLTASMPVDKRTHQPLGLLNGGASCALAETAGSTAANFCVDQSYHYCVGVEINANHLKGVRSGRVHATAAPIHLGQKTHVWEIKIHDDASNLCCIARHTVMVIARKKT